MDPSVVAPQRHTARSTSTSPLPAEDITVAEAADEFVDAAEAGRALNRSGRSYMPSALRDLRGILEYHVGPAIGEMPLREVRRHHVQALVDRLGAEGLSESRIRSIVSALRALYGYAIDRRYVEFNPADGLVMPRADEPWGEPPMWEDQPARERPAPERATASESSEPPRSERPRSADPSRSARKRRGRRDRAAYEPIALLPDRILSFAIRAVFVLLALVAVVSILDSL
jgi:Phage integrase, N-terminal SAM-like domain